MKKAAKNVHLRDPHELASWVNEIFELNPATPQSCPPPLPDSADGGGGIGEWGRGRQARRTVTDYPVNLLHPRGKLVGVGREQERRQHVNTVWC